MKLFVMREPGAQPFGSKAVNAKDVRREAYLLFGFVEEFAQVVRQLVFARNREPTDRLLVGACLYSHCFIPPDCRMIRVFPRRAQNAPRRLALQLVTN